ncbi:hypothetical protein X798_05572 [Onchocerca flexuosa]|uniref:Uncharacterized protein n=1 Tax=Onchocerca flexuosa TaxID=387005 RepID=A0A238BRZ4_9BILA|nr:hypothetical protein X798_05572 [Onchocerca flexuosa]
MMTSAPPPILKSVVDKSRYTQDEILQYVQLSPEEDYCIPSTARCFPEQYVRCRLSFEDPQMDKLYRETNEAMFEHSFPQLFTKEWENHYSSFCPENDLRERRRNGTDVAEIEEDRFQAKTPDDRVNNKKDKKTEVEEKRVRKRIQRIDKIEKPKKMMKCGRE